MNNLLRADSLPDDVLRQSVNFDVDDAGKLVVREGRQRVYAGNILKGSLWHGQRITLFVEDGDLKRLNPDYSADVLRAGIGSSPICYHQLNDVVYYSNHETTGTVRNGKSGSWGVSVPAVQPDCTGAVGGFLAAGVYRVAVTQLSDSDEESGAALPVEVTVPEGGGKIDCVNFPLSGQWLQLYVSPANEENLYFVALLHPATRQYTVDDVSDATTLLELVEAEPPLPCHLITSFNGRIYLAVDNVVYFTDPLSYGLIRRAFNYYLFPSRVTVMEAVSDTIYFCSDKTYALMGIDTQDFLQRDVLPYGGVFGTGRHLANSDAAAWFSPRGFVIGGVQMQVKNQSEGMIAVSAFDEGRILIREQGAINQLIAVLRGGVPNKLVAPDYREREIARRGSYV
jgi:hypothetical protein